MPCFQPLSQNPFPNSSLVSKMGKTEHHLVGTSYSATANSTPSILATSNLTSPLGGGGKFQLNEPESTSTPSFVSPKPAKPFPRQHRLGQSWLSGRIVPPPFSVSSRFLSNDPSPESQGVLRLLSYVPKLNLEY